MRTPDTTEQTGEGERLAEPAGPPVAGIVLIFSGGRPLCAAVPLDGGALEIGRGGVAGMPLDDARTSRRHARIGFDGARWSVTDLGSRNGTLVDGEMVRGERVSESTRVVRMGDSLLLLVRDVRPYQSAGVSVHGDGTVMGPALFDAWQVIARAARFGPTLHVSGESGTGKELAARAFHAFGAHAGGPFVAVNCAAIPTGVAERLLFGARKGAYSDSTVDADGYVQAADSGTLFLDELAELEATVQAKLLRVLESGEVLALGATRARPVDIRICSATHRDLRAQVSAGRLREDLFFRIGRPAVEVPPLRRRLEEIPWLITRALEKQAAHASLVEACLLRHWPGNVRELVTEVRAAVQEAMAVGAVQVDARHLSSSAGQAFAPPPASSDAATSNDDAGETVVRPPAREVIEAALRQAHGNVSAAARALGLHRNQLRRWLARHGLTAQQFGGD
jgi:DNA-binding NtrC family response regulator